jgi:hypothetical protein
VISRIHSSIFRIRGLAAGVRRENGQDAIAGFRSERTRFSSVAGMPAAGLIGRVGRIDSGVRHRKVMASFFVRGPAAVVSCDHDSGFSPNQALLPTSMSVSIPADAGLAPATLAADL